MFRYCVKRMLAMFPTLFGISIICFTLVQFTPGGPVEQLMAQWRQSGAGGETGGGKVSQITEEQRQLLVSYYGFDKPIYVRYFKWMFSLVKGDFGDSYHYDVKVTDLMKRALPVSISFGLFSFLATYLVCIPLGILKAVKQGSRFDVMTSGLVFFLYSIPAFAFGIFVIVLFGGGSFWNWFPIEGIVSENFDDLGFWAKIRDYAHHMFLPLLCYTIGSFATLTMLVKNSVMEQLSQDYVTTARAKGLGEWRVILRHAVRNALIPVANGLGQWLSLFFAGSLLIETIFGLQGIGRLSYDAIIHRDYPVVLGNIMIISVLHMIGNIFSDLMYTLIDPRIKFA